MTIQFCGAARTVTGSCFLLNTGKTKILIDCGAFQGTSDLESLNREPFPFDATEIEYVLLTHAHFDHCGRLPKLVKEGFRGRIISTQPTRELTEIVLKDAAKLQAEEYKRWKIRERNGHDNSHNNNHNDAHHLENNHPNHHMNEKYSEEGSLYEEKEPLYTEADVDATMQLFEIYPYGNSVALMDGLEFRMRDSGHILGAAMYEIWVKNELGRTRKLVFSGDLGQPGQRIVRDPDMVREADYVVMESTYGNRLHKSKDDTVLELLSVLKKASKEGGNILIPTFAIERAQEIIYELNLFFENQLLEGLPVYLDSPMAAKATAVFKEFPTFYDEDARRLLEKGDDPFEFDGFEIIESVEDSKRLVGRNGIVIMAGSGMMTGGRITHHLANNIEKKTTHIIFVGYQVKGTLGRRIVDNEPEVRVKGRKMQVKAQVHTLGGFSAHADMRDLRYWLRGFGHSPRQVFIVHGEESISVGFAANVKQELSIDTVVPSLNEVFQLD
ncbi:MBL fold metallo-hydrolase [Candidatus Nomurabacteria bacterium]|nr:MBL fold metallo-hydrolase [Candidatus Nomurabacteria bacterium]